LAARINEAHEAVASAQKGTPEYAIKTGELLQEAKDKLKHGKWSKWLELNCPNLPARTATDYMKLAEHRSRLGPNRQRAAELSIRGALRAGDAAPYLPRFDFRREYPLTTSSATARWQVTSTFFQPFSVAQQSLETSRLT